MIVKVPTMCWRLLAAKLGLKTAHDVLAVRSYSVTDRWTGDKTDYDYPIAFTYTPCNYGGKRPWFLCPARGCGRRVGKLYLPPGQHIFACRHCHQLTYELRQKSGDRHLAAVRRMERIKAKVNGGIRRTGTMEPFPPKPKGMRWRTCDRLVDEYIAAAQERDVAFWERLGKLGLLG